MRYFFQSKSNANQIRHLTGKSLLTFCVLTILITIYSSTKALAQENSAPASTKISKVTFNPPAGDKPKTSTGGASRSIGQCINQAENSEIPFSALVPTFAKGLTLASHPTVYLYLPPTNANQVFFSWQDENNNDHYQTILPLENQGGIMSLTLPEDAPPLQIGKNYQWGLAIMCDGQLQPDSPMILGAIQRVNMAPTLSQRLKNSNSLETAALYGQAGIWYDTITTLAQLITAQPNNHQLTSNWQELLNSVGLSKFATTPLVQ